MKTCIGCKLELEDEAFPWKSKAKGRRQPRCSSCYGEYNRAYYASTERGKQINRVRVNNDKVRVGYQEWKATQKCLLCSEDSPECLDLHHLDPAEKDRAVSQLTGFGWKRLQKEIDKCVVLCSNCHRKVHADRICLLHP